MTEEHIDHEEARKIAERFGDIEHRTQPPFYPSPSDTGSLARHYLALLTEHYAREEREKKVRRFLVYLRPHLAAGSVFGKTMLVQDLDELLVLTATEPAQPEQTTLVYCTRCCKTHAVTPGETPCAPGAWIDPQPAQSEEERYEDQMHRSWSGDSSPVEAEEEG
jgi:hypothetical protein